MSFAQTELMSDVRILFHLTLLKSFRKRSDSNLTIYFNAWQNDFADGVLPQSRPRSCFQLIDISWVSLPRFSITTAQLPSDIGFAKTCILPVF